MHIPKNLKPSTKNWRNDEITTIFKLDFKLDLSWAMSQTDPCLSYTIPVLYVDKDLVTANILTGNLLYLLNTVGCIHA